MSGKVAPPADFAELIELSVRLGSDPAQVQGAGGNTSLKDENTLWVKASGVWLSEVGDRPGFVAVDRKRLLADLAEDPDRTEDPKPYAMAGESLRPSIETTLHAMLPGRVVLHTHSVDAIALLASEDAEAALDRVSAVPGARPVLVPYARPGLPLTRAALGAMTDGEGTNVLLLANHGLVVAADTVDEAARLLDAVTASLNAEPRAGLPRDRSRDVAWAEAGYRPIRDGEGLEAASAIALATDERSAAIATSGSLYPDHVVFLGRGLGRAERPAWPQGEGPAMLLDPGHGAFLREDASPAAGAMARCLADVATRMTGTPRPIGAEAEDALLGWDAEKHRQKLERSRT